MYFVMDMGTSNTRLFLCDGTAVIDEAKEPFGAKLGKTQGRDTLYENLHRMICELLNKHRLAESDVECLVVSGMAGSEMGLCEIPHLPLPMDETVLARELTKKSIPTITSIPFLFVPGLKRTQADEIADIMRGEETEIVGILSAVSNAENAVIVLPGTHNKIVILDENGGITDFYSTLSGELTDLVISGSILAGSVSHQFQVFERQVRQGMEYADLHGLNAALFHIRVMEKNGIECDALSSFLYGAILGQDVKLIRRYAHGNRIYLGGNRQLQTVYRILLENERVVALDRELADSAVCRGLQRIYRIHKAQLTRQNTLNAIETEKVIAIIRNPDPESLFDAMQALYDGGIRLAEVTFDRSGKITPEQTCSTIASLVKRFEGKMLIGAGTVTDCKEVALAFEAGAAFMISPNCDSTVIALTRKLGLVSMPAAYTPTEIVTALNHGADYVKLFPSDQVSANYVKAIKAPLSDAKLIAVGGVNADNVAEFLQMGFCGVGIGSNLYDKKLIHERNFSALTELARSICNAVK